MLRLKIFLTCMIALASLTAYAVPPQKLRWISLSSDSRDIVHEIIRSEVDNREAFSTLQEDKANQKDVEREKQIEDAEYKSSILAATKEFNRAKKKRDEVTSQFNASSTDYEESAKEWAVRAEAAEMGGSLGRRANLVGAIMLRQGLPDQARQQLEKALKWNRADASAGEEANALRLLGEIHLAAGSNDSALGCYQGALALDKELGFAGKIAADLRGIGTVLRNKSDIPGAVGFYQRALQVSLNSGDASLAADDMAQLAQLYRLNGDSSLARQMDEERKKLMEKR